MATLAGFYVCYIVPESVIPVAEIVFFNINLLNAPFFYCKKIAFVCECSNFLICCTSNVSAK